MLAAVTKRNIRVLDRWRGKVPERIRRRLRFFSNAVCVEAPLWNFQSVKTVILEVVNLLLEVSGNFSERTSLLAEPEKGRDAQLCKVLH